MSTNNEITAGIAPDMQAGAETASAGLAAPRRRRWSLLDRWALAALAVAGLVAVPIAVVFGHVFVPAGEVWDHLAETVLARYVANTLGLVVGVGVLVLLIGISTAWLVTMCRFPGRRLFEWALLLPMAVPAYVIAYTYAGMLDYAGPVQEALRALAGWQTARDYWFPEIRSLGGAIVVMALVLYPYVYLLARAAFQEQSVCVIEISRTLGRSPWRSFTDVALPLARPAVVTGLSLVLMEVLADFGTVQYFAVDTFTTGIYRTWFGLGDQSAAAQLAALLMTFVFALVLLERLTRGRARYHHTSRRYRPLPGYRLRGVRLGLALAACGLPVVLGFVLPAVQLGYWAVLTADIMIDARFLSLAANTLLLAIVAALLAVLVALVLAYGVRIAGSPVVRAGARVAAMGYAVPGSVIAVGIMLPLATLDNALIGWMKAAFGVNPGLLLTGTIFALLYAYLVRFLAVSLNTVEASLGKVTGSMDDAARVFGLGPAATLRKVHVPIISGSLLTAGLLVFVDVMKELPATLIMRPFNFDTLAIRAFELASDERLEDAASAALAIVVVGILPVVMMSRAISRARPGSGGEGNGGEGGAGSA